LGLAGATLQSVLRNPLAEPYMLGLTGGASLFAALAVHTGIAAFGAWTLPASAACGSAFSLALVVSVSALARDRRPETVILAGFVTGAFTGSLQMVVLSQTEPETFANLSKWLFGDLHAVKGTPLAAAAGCVIAASVFLFSRARKLNALALGEDLARTLGVHVRRETLMALLAASLATAAAVSVAGAIGFLGLVTPHVARRFVGADHRKYLLLSAVLGGVFLVAADLLGSLFPCGISAGIVCALCGGPFFLWLLVWKKR